MNNEPKQTCCEQWAKAHESGTDNEGWGALIHARHYNDEPTAGLGLDSVRFCPWCGTPKGVPTPELKGLAPLVLYFATEEEKNDFVALVKEAKPGMITKHL